MAGSAAFSAARYKIKTTFFQELNAKVVAHIQQLPAKTWNGYQLIAVDGSTVSLPASQAIKVFFGVAGQSVNGIKTCLAQVLICYDVLNKYVHASIIDKMERGEKSLFRLLLPEMRINDAIFILDRGFGHFNVCKMLFLENKNFCIRLGTQISSFAKNAMLVSENDFITIWEPSKKEIENCRKHRQDSSPIKVRVTKVVLDTGEIELLVSNIYKMDMIDEKAMKELYFMRWGIEENIKKLKPKMKLEHFGCKKPEGIYQEFYAHIFMLNLVALIGNDAQEKVDIDTKGRKLNYQYNWQNAYRHVRDKIIKLINNINLQKIIDDLFQKIASSVVAVIDERKFSRDRQNHKKSLVPQCYK